MRRVCAISLANICGQGFDRDELTNLLLQKVEAKYFQLQKGEIEALRKKYIANLYWKNEIHVFQSEGTYFNGRILNVEPTGKLRMEIEKGERLFDFKEVKFIK